MDHNNWAPTNSTKKRVTIFRTPFRKGKGTIYTNSSWGLYFFLFYNTDKEEILNKFDNENYHMDQTNMAASPPGPQKNYHF